MSNEDKKTVNFDKGVEESDTACSQAKAAVEVPGETLSEKAGGEYVRTIYLLARTERLLTLRAEDVRLAAARLAEAQEELVRLVGAVRDLAETAASHTRESQFLAMSVQDNLRPAARAVIFLARILKKIYGLSSTIKDTVESQSATMRELTAIISEAAKVSTYLTGKVAALAEETRTLLPPLSSKNLVEAELQCLTSELEEAVKEFRSPKTVTKAGIDDVTAQLLAKPPVVN